ncbi:hypothetical protein ACLBWJ_15535 [Microbacterium sp. M4A5_1d]
MSTRDYEAASAAYADPAQPVSVVGPIHTGAAAAQIGRDFLVEQYGSLEKVNAEIKRGRPRVGEKRTPTKIVKGRVPEADAHELEAIEEETGLTESELVRRGIALLIKSHRESRRPVRAS